MGSGRKGLVSPQATKVAHASMPRQMEDELGSAANAMLEGTIRPPKPQFRGLSQELVTARFGGVIQPKLVIGNPDDRYEQEADRVASNVVQKIHSPQLTQQTEGIQRQDKGKIQPKLNGAIAGGTVTTDLESSIQSARGSGQPLTDTIRQPMEQAFSSDFSGVKVHTDSQSNQLNQSIQAKAFTTGQDIFFREGAYDPASRDGQELIAHELTHVVQQNAGVQRFSEESEANLKQKNADKHNSQNRSNYHKFFYGEGKDDDVVPPSKEELEDEKSKRKINRFSSLNEFSVASELKKEHPQAVQRVFYMDEQGVAHDHPQRIFHMDSTGVAHDHPKPKATTAISRMQPAGPNATGALDPDDYGICDTETVTPTLTAYKEGDVWRSAVTNFDGAYSKVVRLPVGLQEVTGPGGNTTLANSRKQIKDLKNLGGSKWYMLQAVEDHESVHETRLAPALENVEPVMQNLFTALTVPDGGGVNDKDSAVTAIKQLPAYATEVSRLRNIWDHEYVNLIGNDHSVLTPNAEHAVVDPMINQINTFRTSNGKSAV